MEFEQTVILVDDNCDLLKSALQPMTLPVEYFSCPEELLQRITLWVCGCILVEQRFPQMSGIQMKQELRRRGLEIPVIMVTAIPTLSLALQAMRAGFAAFFEKPLVNGALRDEVLRCLAIDAQRMERQLIRSDYQSRLARLSAQELKTLTHLAHGKLNKQIAEELNVSERSVETYRKRLMDKLDLHSLADLVYFAIACNLRKLPHQDDHPPG